MKLSNVLITVLAVTTLASGFAVYKFDSASERLEQDNIALSQLNLQLVRELENLKNDLSVYQQELKKSEAPTASLNDEVLALKSYPVASELATIPAAPEEKPEYSEDNSSETKTDMDVLLAFASRMRSGESISSIEDKALTQFREEEVDGSWAYQYEANIRDFIASDEDRKFDIQELTCKRTLCELKIIANDDNALQLGTLFSKSLSEQEWRDNSAPVMFNHETKDGVMRILIGRDKSSLN